MHAIKRNKNLGRTVGVWESRVPDEKGTINWKTVTTITGAGVHLLAGSL